MSLARTNPILRLCRLAVMAALLGLWLLGEQACQASCGDYLVHPSSPTQSLEGASLPQETPTTPCRGANCSRRSETPPLPTRPTVETTSVEWLCVIEQIRGQNDESHHWSLESGSLMAQHTSQLLDRPPRG
ncbi:MAG: hypothetical protein ACKV2Q_29695 [Planctomycetaceae bacterium]